MVFSFKTPDTDQIVGCIDVSATGAVAVATFRAFAPCPVYVVAGTTTHVLAHNFPVAALKFSPARPSILVTVSDFIRVWNTESGQLISVTSPHDTDSPEVCPFTAIDFGASNLYAVTDAHGFCSIWDLDHKDPVEVFDLGSEKLFDVAFVSDEVVGCLGETGALYVINRPAHQVVCSQGVEAVPRCQPVKLAWLHGLSLVAIANQTSGTVSVYELKSTSDSPRLLGTTKPGDSIADIVWVKSHPQYFLVARDSGAIEVWNRNNLVAPHFDLKSGSAASAVHCVESSVLIGTTKGEVVFSELPSRMESQAVASLTYEQRWESRNSDSYPALA